MTANKKNIAIICILLVVIICMGSFILYDKVIKKDEDKITNIEIKTDEEKRTEITIDLSIIDDAFEIMDKMGLQEEDLYKDKIYNITDISNNSLIITAINNLDSNKITFCSSDDEDKGPLITFEELNFAVSKTIKNKIITNETIKSLEKSQENQNEYNTIDKIHGYNYTILLEEKGIRVDAPCGGEGIDPFVESKIVKIGQDEEHIYVYKKQAFAELINTEEDSDYLSVNYYKSYKRDISVQSNVAEYYNPKWELYDTYKYTFKVEKNNYYFEKLELQN